MPNYTKRGNTVFVGSSESSKNYTKLPLDNYIVQYNQMMGFYLETMELAKLPKKLYGNHEKDAHRILNTFFTRPRATGVLLNGEKGSGKTMLARLISKFGAEKSVPTLIVNSPYSGDDFNSFISSITDPCIVLFDEFEKVYNKDSQESVLTLLDGMFTGQKLYILTCNDIHKIDINMKNRPGRLFYNLQYEGLDYQFIKEYCEDNLLDKTHVEAVCNSATLFAKFNFDMLQAIVEEMNRYNEAPMEALRMLNCKPEKTYSANYSIHLFKDGKQIDSNRLHTKSIRIAPLTDSFNLHLYDRPVNFDEWGDPIEEPVKKGSKATAKNKSTIINFNPYEIVSMNAKDETVVFTNADQYTVILKKTAIKQFSMGTAFNGISQGYEGYSFDVD